MSYTTMIVIIVALVMSELAWESWLDAKYHYIDNKEGDNTNEDDNRH